MKNHPILSDRKLIVHDLKVERPNLPEEYEQDAWNRLKRAISSIKQDEAQHDSLEVLYQLCENLCQYDKAQELYDLLYAECFQIVQDQFDSLNLDLDKDETFYLNKVNRLWKEYCEQMSQIRGLFLYLDRTFALNAKGGSIWTMAMDLLRSSFLQHEAVRHKMLSSILELIRLERTSQEIDLGLLQSVIRMLLDLNLYHNEFEPSFLKETRAFYGAEGDHLIETIPMGDYLDHVSTRVHQESSLRVKRYFDKSTKAPLQAIVEEELLTKRVTTILDKCFSYFHENYLVDELSLLYRLLKKVGQLNICAKYFTNYIKTKGSSILCDKMFVQEKMNVLSTFKKKNEYIVDHSFEGDEQFLDGLKDGTEYFINLKENGAIKLLAKHADNVVKNEKMDEKQLDQCMFLFHHLQGKDEFEILYKRDLAKRLLLDTTNRNAEKVMLAKMKKECGAAYTSKLEGMLRDMKQSNELMQEFNKVQDLYTNAYMTKYPRRRLTWQNSLSVCEVDAHYPKVKHAYFDNKNH
ncbi:hypothetical protein RO3G_13698 [Rhizopus delemar RA 99-880]|uniref:Cullin family profile domain-containing protein n=1 Tax=Rhizopus delemar (strain RA 99-880 / ATCC MYA-4621 / FGSC 9543 / NRRL 43880) TaxID=246409 RepID=I1CKK7_RHIO9|nr:hypothetical protein RO3G_13698 [Rhizopus delemar RA 99-880]|eukprot:EIE88987.1 hypothetical protein RO3G_13698 [Rhizopus delemar RA 99-880]